MKTSLLRLSIILGPIWFFALVLLVGAITPGYSHISQAISELGESGAPYGWIINLGGFLPLGILFVAFALTMRRFPGAGIPQTTAFVLVGLTGIAIIAAGIFQCDPGGRRDSLEGILHAIAGLITLIVSSITPFVMAVSLTYHQSPERGFRIYSFVTGIVLTSLFLMTPNAILPGLVELQSKILGALFPVWYRILGLHQRVFMAIYFVWLGTFAQLHWREDERLANR